MSNQTKTAAVLLVLVCAPMWGCDTGAPPAAASPSTASPPSLPPPTAPSAPPVVAPPPSPAGPGACSLQGQWSGRINPGPTPFANSPVTADYRADHTINWGTNLARFTGTWQVDGATLHVTDTSSTIPQAACPPTQIGNYALDWAPDCSVVTFRLTADLCDGRKPALSDLRLTRAQ